MKVAYQTLLLLFTLSCTPSSVYRISHEHLERKPNYVSLGIWGYGAFWVEILDNQTTSWPFDEAVWKSTSVGTVDYIDRVCADGNIHRYYWHWEKKEFLELAILTLDDGRNMNPFQYIDLIIYLKRAPI